MSGSSRSALTMNPGEPKCDGPSPSSARADPAIVSEASAALTTMVRIIVASGAPPQHDAFHWRTMAWRTLRPTRFGDVGARRSGSPTPRDEPKDDDDDGHDEQHVNEARRDVEGEETKRPQHEENERESP